MLLHNFLFFFSQTKPARKEQEKPGAFEGSKQQLLPFSTHSLPLLFSFLFFPFCFSPLHLLPSVFFFCPAPLLSLFFFFLLFLWFSLCFTASFSGSHFPFLPLFSFFFGSLSLVFLLLPSVGSYSPSHGTPLAPSDKKGPGSFFFFF